MIVKALAENTSCSEDLGCEHGLSLYIEALGRKILFDMGQGTLFAENAKKMDVDLSKVEIAVISHGHYDHGGGLRTFLELNDKAKIYLQKGAFEKHYSDDPGRKVYIGLDERLLPNDRFVLCDGSAEIARGLELLSSVCGSWPVPSGNAELLMKVGETYLSDDFSHEQSLIVRENEKTLLISGCAHRGILNILECYGALKGGAPDYVIGGFHLSAPGKNEDEAPETVSKVAEALNRAKTKYYTCHCTGAASYKRLKSVLGDKIDYLSAGSGLAL